jgi:CubicO group peptidase (beta-lactamase class C family)
LATRILPTAAIEATWLELNLRALVAASLDRWPSAGLAAGVVRDGSFEWFLGHGVADLRSQEPITQETVFRVGSLTKTFTAIAVMQLWEQGLVDLDAPANDYLRTFRLGPAKATFRPATVRHLLTHTAGVGYWRRLSDLLQPGVGSGDRAGRAGAPLLADYCSLTPLLFGRGVTTEMLRRSARATSVRPAVAEEGNKRVEETAHLQRLPRAL